MTNEEIRAKAEKSAKFLSSLRFVEEYTIENYPIGGRNRGKCKLTVEHRPGKGFRRIKQTTNKHGEWCKPKKSTYVNAPTFVVEMPGSEMECGWLHMSKIGGIGIMYANGEDHMLFKPPHWAKPSREPRHYTIVKRELYSNKEERIPQVTPADPPGLCDAYDEYEEQYTKLHFLVADLHQGVEPGSVRRVFSLS